MQYDEAWAAAGTWDDNAVAVSAGTVRVAGGVGSDPKKVDG